MAVYPLKPARKPPLKERGLIAWLRKNLLSSPFNIALTIFGVAILYMIIPPFIKWAFIDANFVGNSKADCTGDGACWVFIKEKLNMFIFGFYPQDILWRPKVVMLGLVALLIFAKFVKGFNKLKLFLIVIYPIIGYILLHGGYFGLEVVETSKWGGLLLTLIIASVGIVLSFPIGVILALGRQSKLPIIRSLSIFYIELIRGVPLITVLFMASVVLPLFFPQGVDFDKLARALIGISLFEAAYVAENIRSGFQAIPKGQYEAADSLGLTYWQKMGLIILPQAIRVTIPNLVGTFISLFKDTSLVMIIGLFDLLSMVNVAANDRDWLGMETEGYVFVAFIFWIFTFGMSLYSKYLEKKLDINKKG
ncbi:MAG: amino acid ABC transporter permease [Epsilonproteobacteria bacterium]|nr:amino acid ABC transporter permease [Campylobacterota bacterium]